MNDRIHIDHLLQDYLDDALPPAERLVVEAHLRVCSACRAEKEALASVLSAVHALPRRLDPPRDLWPEIEARLARPAFEDADFKHHLNGRADRVPVPPETRRVRLRTWQAAALAATLVIVVGAIWLLAPLLAPAWNVAAVEGTPRVGATPLTATGRLYRGEWIETDDRSRAALDVGAIGNVEVWPNTRVQMVEARAREHRLALAEGTIHARIWAPPRLFFVETPSALAIDLGCEYTLTVDSLGGSLLHVTSGYVELQHGERTAVVPQGSMCLTRPGLGPGTPFAENASEAFRRALARFDFEGGTAEALNDLLAEAGPDDAATLWRLMYVVDTSRRSRLYDRLVELAGAPDGVSRDAVLNADIDAIAAWDRHLGLDFDDGWFFRLFTKKKK